MSTTSTIFVIAGESASRMTTRITTAFPEASTTSQSAWSLTQSLYRATPDPSNPQASSSFLHILQLSSHPGRTFLCTVAPGNDGPEISHAIAIPRETTSSGFKNLLNSKFGPLWQPLRQGELRVASGATWDVGLFRVRVGELVRERSAGTGGPEAKGAIVAVNLGSEYLAGGLGGDSEQEKTLIEEFCEDVGFLGPARGLGGAGETWGDCGAWQGEVALWCEVMRKQLAATGVRSRGANDKA